MTAKIEKIVLTVGKKTIELSIDEAKELRSILCDTFGREVVKETQYIPYIPCQQNDWIYKKWTPSYSGGTAGNYRLQLCQQLEEQRK
jgi:hypothetical protein